MKKLLAVLVVAALAIGCSKTTSPTKTVTRPPMEPPKGTEVTPKVDQPPPKVEPPKVEPPKEPEKKPEDKTPPK